MSAFHEGNKPLTEEYANKLKGFIRQAAKADKDFQVFGAQKHQYRLNPVVSPAQIKAFEQKYHVQLPEEYVFFLTHVGNGGAGPYYGLYSLEQVAVYTEKLQDYTEEDRENCPAVIDKSLTKESWAELTADEEEETAGEKADAAWEETMRRLCSGVLVIGTQGCTYDHLLMWKGSEKGKIVIIDWNLEPEAPPFLTGLSFLTWYESFFREIAAGHKMDSFGYISLKPEEELAADFCRAKTAEERRQCIAGFYKFNKVSKETIRFLEGIKAPEIDDARTELLFRFDQERGCSVFKTLLAENPNAAVSCARRMPGEKKDAFYPAMLSLLYRPDIREKERVCYFLHDCRCKKAGDFVSFVLDENNAENERKAAIYVMGLCRDKRDYLSVFIDLMKGESYWLAHTALQAVSRMECRELLPVYEWMWEKYGMDSVMRSNLKIAFQANGRKG